MKKRDSNWLKLGCQADLAFEVEKVKGFESDLNLVPLVLLYALKLMILNLILVPPF